MLVWNVDIKMLLDMLYSWNVQRYYRHLTEFTLIRSAFHACVSSKIERVWGCSGITQFMVVR